MLTASETQSTGLHFKGCLLLLSQEENITKSSRYVMCPCDQSLSCVQDNEGQEPPDIWLPTKN